MFFSKERGCVNGIVGYIGDGYCDDAGCHFDGGDCKFAFIEVFQS